MTNQKIVVALDVEFDKAKKIVNVCLENGLKMFKVGHLLFDTNPKIIDYITKCSGEVVLDLKFNDIPSVVSKAVVEISKKYKIFAMTVHILGGKQMLQEVVMSIKHIKDRPIIFGVTILTSLNDTDIKELGFKKNFVKDQVFLLTKYAKVAGLDGVVCSAKEVKKIKSQFGKNFLTLVPGVSIEKNISFDQKRTLSLDEVIKNGADYVVIGRSIYESDNIYNRIKNIKDKFF